MFKKANTTLGRWIPEATMPLFHRFTQSSILSSSLCVASALIVLGCSPDGDPAALDEAVVTESGAETDGERRMATPQSANEPSGEALAERKLTFDLRDSAMPPAPPVFQMPFFYHQTWRASTYDGHYPNQNSIDLGFVSGNSLGQVVVASAAGTVADVGPVKSPEGDYYGDYVNIDHGDGWETRYLHIVKSAAIVKGSTVVRGQRLGTVGQYHDMGVHLHYTQLKSGAAVRIAFNGTPINVWQGAKKSDGTYPTQELLSNNIPTGITVGFVSGGVTATSSTGAGVRAVALCENLLKHIESSIEGPRVAAKQTSTTKCPAGFLFSDATYALE